MIQFPPEYMIKEYSGSKDGNNYVLVGRKFAEFFETYIKSGERVLEIGCGCARIAQAIPRDIFYEGFDVDKDSIQFCKTLNIPNFNFQWVDLANTNYNKEGKESAEDFIFPFEDHSFDFIYLTSVFTHVNSLVTKHYIDEIKRVLKFDKYCGATFYIVSNGEGANRKWHKKDNYWVNNFRNPDAVTGYDESFIRKLMPVVSIDSAVGQDLVIFKNLRRKEWS